VLDARAQSRTAAAVVLGMQVFDPRIRIGGVVLNHVGSGRHERLLRAAMAELGVPVLGTLRRDPQVMAPSRHLGLIPARERGRHSKAVVEALGQLVAASVDLDAVLALARSAPPVDAMAWDPGTELAEHARVRTGSDGSAPVVAMAGGAAFTFSYPETSELLAAAGARVTVFDPLVDPHLPAGTRGVVIGGGFPELHVEALAGNGALREELAGFEGPMTAECAGLLYLGRSLDGVPMCGRLDLQARMTPRLVLGYRRAVAESDSPVAARGEVIQGHEFHRTATDPGHGTEAAWSWEGQRHGFVAGAVHASYLHTHWAGHPKTAARFVAACG
jgi:cobyrinic acid a,c-diamide synthase